MKDADLQHYYARRAAEYEAIYHKPERQQDLPRLQEWVCERLHGRRVLEIACGTGYWTAIVAPVAQSILATDTSTEVLDIARSKPYPPGRVAFALADAYALHAVPGDFDAALAAFWWSHIPKGAIGHFLQGLHRRLAAGAVVVLLDNRYVEGSSTPLAEQDADGNTYQIRPLKDGSRHRVLKNFPSAQELRAALAPSVRALEIRELDYYWCAAYEVRG